MNTTIKLILNALAQTREELVANNSTHDNETLITFCEQLAGNLILLSDQEKD